MCAACDLEGHKAECLMEPRKLLAAIHKLHAENQRLDAENMELRSGGKAIDVFVPDSRKRQCNHEQKMTKLANPKIRVR